MAKLAFVSGGTGDYISLTDIARYKVIPSFCAQRSEVAESILVGAQ